MGKELVSMGQHLCSVCGQPFDSGEILIAKRINKQGGSNLEQKTVTGYGLCEAHQKLYDEGYLALVEAKDPGAGADRMKQADAYRLGRVAHVRFSKAEEMFTGVDLYEKNGKPQVLMFAPPEVLDMFEQAAKELEQ